jgi:hypothetical protein
MLLFIPWDIWKTVRGVWGFNPDYIEGVWLWELPLEEWLFFICIPYACVFIYECLIAYFPRDIFKTTYRAVLTLLAVFLIAIGLLNYHKWYAAITFPLTGFMLLSLLYYFKSPWLSRFLAAYLVSLIPFLLVNGVLTGSFLAEPVVWYNPDEIFNIRIFNGIYYAFRFLFKGNSLYFIIFKPQINFGAVCFILSNNYRCLYLKFLSPHL